MAIEQTENFGQQNFDSKTSFLLQRRVHTILPLERQVFSR